MNRSVFAVVLTALLPANIHPVVFPAGTTVPIRFLTAVTSGRVGVGTVLRLRACPEDPSPTAQSDTSRPPVPRSRLLPDDSTRTVPSPWGTAERYYRDIVGVMFYDTTSGKTIRTILSKYQASVVAGGPALPYPAYYLQVPDPGGTYTAIDAVAEAMGREPGVSATTLPQWRGRIIPRSPLQHWDEPSSRIARVSGRLWDVQHHVPVSMGMVVIVGTTLTAQTDSSGAFTISGALAPGCHRLIARWIGYGVTEVRFQTTAGDSTDLGFVPMRFAPVHEWPMLLVAGCEAGPIPKEEAPWGVDTLKTN